MQTLFDRRDFLRTCAIGASSVGALMGAGSAAFLLSGCSSAAPETQLTGDGGPHENVTVLFSDAPNSFDPVNKWDGWYTSCRGLTETLVVFDEHMNPAPGLALSWEPKDENTWEFTLRENVVFQSGRAMDADAVVDSLKRAIEKSPRAKEKLQAESISAAGMTLTIKTQTPVATLPGELAEPVFSIVDTQTVEQNPHLAGTGPYHGANVERKEEFTLAAHEQYWGGTPQTPQITCRCVTDAQTRALALQSGDAQVAHSILAQDIQTLGADGRYQILRVPSVRSVFLMMNHTHPALSQLEVRKALAALCDSETLCATICQDTVSANSLPYPESTGLFDRADFSTVAFNVAAAEEALERAGWRKGSDGVREKDGVSLSLRLAYYASRPELTLMAPALQQMFAQVGVQVQPQLYEQIDTTLHAGDFDLALYNATTLGNGDPSYFMSVYFDSASTENVMNYQNPEVDELLAQLRATFDTDERMRLARSALKLIMEDVPCVFIGNPVMNVIEAPGVDGYRLLPVEFYGINAALTWK